MFRGSCCFAAICLAWALDGSRGLIRCARQRYQHNGGGKELGIGYVDESCAE
jgi:hypothetical protein